MRKALVEDARLHRERDLGGKNFVLEPTQGAKRGGAQPECHQKRHERAHQGHETDRNQEAPEAADQLSVPPPDEAAKARNPTVPQPVCAEVSLATLSGIVLVKVPLPVSITESCVHTAPPLI